MMAAKVRVFRLFALAYFEFRAVHVQRQNDDNDDEVNKNVVVHFSSAIECMHSVWCAQHIQFLYLFDFMLSIAFCVTMVFCFSFVSISCLL